MTDRDDDWLDALFEMTRSWAPDPERIEATQTCRRCGKILLDCICGEDRVSENAWKLPPETDPESAHGLVREINELGPKPPQHDVVESLLQMGFVFPTKTDVSGLPPEAFMVVPTFDPSDRQP